jgi:hypothetical protein
VVVFRRSAFVCTLDLLPHEKFSIKFTHFRHLLQYCAVGTHLDRVAVLSYRVWFIAVGSRIPANNEIVRKAVKCGLARCHSAAASISVFVAVISEKCEPVSR